MMQASFCREQRAPRYDAVNQCFESIEYSYLMLLNYRSLHIAADLYVLMEPCPEARDLASS